ncbi:hypothetical protein SARC_00890 [Sphaeroforma arctica JP610]|uniref:Mss4-like protein n=1 Tax=Sphaeroforma arctica JP610 TaxID=667725 RepID=A0A0L0GDA8_9EUKA|nr:hypothetical protein SARC_00890 [Sphaeroforma arctica JP610]KNC86997.1 hypothetical protein SARC_00890 [Sphaeroforma arctica JP610]|eukprot:XP_014160899.1 hypothetical protein SARC_00890 [Sphaeroforma arctica JP610]
MSEVSKTDAPMPERHAGDKNPRAVRCSICTCKILNANLGVYTDITKDLPETSLKAKEVSTIEAVTGFWEVSDMFDFENVGFSHSVKEDNSEDLVKYLTCADCEYGPIGWCLHAHSQEGAIKKSFYLCATEKRIKYE